MAYESNARIPGGAYPDPVDPGAAKRERIQRLLAALAGGLGAQNQGEGFGGGFGAGFSGAVGGGMAFQRQRHEEMRQQQRDEAEQRRHQRATEQWEASFGLQKRQEERMAARDARPDTPAVGAIPWYEALPDTDPRKGLYRTDATREPTGARPEKPQPWELPPGQQAKILDWNKRLKAVTPRAKPATGAERTALAFYNRAKEAEGTIGQLEGKIAQSSLTDQYRLRYAPNVMQTPDQQVYRQAQRSFTEARLRKESGAAIPTAEYENDSKTYFAQPGDSKATIQKKTKARQSVLNGLKFSSGRAYDEYYNGVPVSESGGDVEWIMGDDGNLVPAQ